MAKREGVTFRRVPLQSEEAGEARVAGTPTERLRLTSELSQSAWSNTGKPLPSYARRDMPIRIVRLGERPDRD